MESVLEKNSAFISGLFGRINGLFDSFHLIHNRCSP